MAQLTATKPLDLLSPGFNVGDPQGTVVSISATSIVLRENTGDLVTLSGNFIIANGIPIGGTLDGVEEAGVSVGYKVTGLGATYLDLLPLVQAAANAGDGFGVVSYLMRGNDSLIGSAGNDRLVGLDGNDTVIGGSGDDDVNGNTGNDFVQGSSGADFVRGGQGNDVVYGGNGDDWHVNGNIGNDTVYGDGGQDAGADTIFGGQGNDLVFGDFGAIDKPGGNDSIDGNLGDDIIFGEVGNDTLVGGAGNDMLLGEEDSDVLIGGAGNDTVHGGIDHDQFVFTSGGGDDVIDDYAVGTDIMFFTPSLNGLALTIDNVFATITQRMTDDGLGNTIINLGNGDSVYVLGVTPGQFTTADIGLIIM